MDHKIWTDVVMWVNVGGRLRFWLLYNFDFNTRYKICLLQTRGSRGRIPYKIFHRATYIYIYIKFGIAAVIKIIIIIINIISIIGVRSGAVG